MYIQTNVHSDTNYKIFQMYTQRNVHTDTNYKTLQIYTDKCSHRQIYTQMYTQTQILKHYICTHKNKSRNTSGSFINCSLVIQRILINTVTPPHSDSKSSRQDRHDSKRRPCTAGTGLHQEAVDGCSRCYSESTVLIINKNTKLCLSNMPTKSGVLGERC